MMPHHIRLLFPSSLHHSMPVTHNTHTNTQCISPIPAHLPCTFEGCDHTFTLKSRLTRHLRASHQPTDMPSSPLIIPVAGSIRHSSPLATPVASSSHPSSSDHQPLRCPFPECGYPVKTRRGLTLHTRTFHLQHSVEPASPVLSTGSLLEPQEAATTNSITASNPGHHLLPISPSLSPLCHSSVLPDYAECHQDFDIVCYNLR